MIKKWIINEFIKNNIKKYIIGIVALIASCLLQMSIPEIQGTIIDMLADKSSSQSRVLSLAGLMLVIAILLFCLKYIWRYYIMGRARDLECFLRSKLFSHLQALDVKFFNNKKTGDLMAHAINDLNAIRQSFAFGLVFLIDGVIINLTSVFIMVKMINPLLTLIALMPIVLSVGIIIKLRSAIRVRFTEVQKAFSDISEKAQENISGIRVVKAYVQEEYETEKLGKASTNRMKVQMNYIRLSGALGPAIQVFFGISYSITIILGSRYVATGVISLGDFVAFNMYLAMLTAPVTNIGRIVEVWQKSLASMKRLDDIFYQKSEIFDDNPVLKDKKLDGSLVVRDLNFKYPGTNEYVLKNININVESGKTLAIIGRTGSGKTTLINLLLRLYSIEKGHIFIDGVDINDVEVATLRESIGCVPQDNFLFSATIKENLEFFKKIYTDEQIENAARMASVYDNIMEFPDKFETTMGERGITVSGGQKQRISIARAMIKDPSILILDDSLSAVDTKTEEEILSNIKQILRDRTGIIVAHRISTIKHADEIVMLDNGEIVERGAHEELLEKGGSYYRLYCAQLAESRLHEEEEATI